MEKSPSSASKPLACALRVLARRDHSESELRQKLEGYGFSVTDVDGAVERCYSYNYLDDSRYALARCRDMLRSGRGVGPKILLELKRRGISDLIARQALALAGEEISNAEVFRQQLERRFTGFSYATANDKERRRVIAYFQRRGFDLGTIFNLLKNTSESDEN